jgi:hypothetical protein
MMSEEYRWARLIAVTALITLAIAVGGMSACDIRARQQATEMAKRGFCRVGSGPGDVWIPCALPVVKP